MRRRRAAVGLAAALLLAAAPQPAPALDLFARHEVTVQLATHDGTPMADAEVQVFAPGKPDKPVLTGHTDSAGKYEFPANEDGLWSVEARAGGEIARVTVRVGGGEGGARLSPLWVIGGLFLLLALAFAYRILRARARRPRK